LTLCVCEYADDTPTQYLVLLFHPDDGYIYCEEASSGALAEQAFAAKAAALRAMEW
jgi:hypothetical protein